MKPHEEFLIVGAWKRTTPLEYWEYSIGRIGAFLGNRGAEVLARLALGVARADEDILCVLYLMDPRRWPSASSVGWTELGRRQFVRKGLFGTENQHVLVAGKADRLESLKSVIGYGWNSAGSESFHVLPGRARDVESLLEGFVDDVGADDENEKALLTPFRTILSRDHDGGYLRVLSKDLTRQGLSEHLQQALSAAAAAPTNQESKLG